VHRGVETLVETEALRAVIERQTFPPVSIKEDKDLTK
jgi:hypothetical protein